MVVALGMVSCHGENDESTPTTPVAPLVVTPNNVSVNQGATFQFRTSSPVNWSVQGGAAGGSITADGLYTAPNSSGTFFVVATAQDLSRRTGSARVFVPAVRIFTRSNRVTMATDESANLAPMVSVTGTVNTAVAWTIPEGAAAGSVTEAGLYTPPAAFGTYRVIATSQANTALSVTINVVVGPVAVSISPPSDTLGPGGVRPFTLAVTAIDKRVTWSVSEAPLGGSLDGSRYTAPNNTGNYQVVATSVHDPTASASATVTVVPAGFRPAVDMLSARTAHTATALPDGRVLITGGSSCFFSFYYYYDSCELKQAELYDPASNKFTSANGMSAARVLHAATLLPDGKLLISGGSSAGGPRAELYESATGAWSATGSMTASRVAHTATLLENGKVLLAGGVGTNASNASAELYDPQSGTFAPTLGGMNLRRSFHTATRLANGQILVTGGQLAGNAGITSTAELYDPIAESFAATGSMSTARAYHRATLLSNGTVLITGGLSVSSGTRLNSTEIYDPASGQFSATGNMLIGRDSHFAIPLPNGKVLVSGGYVSGAGALAFTAELFDPVTGTFTQTGSMTEARVLPTAVLLADGRVLVTGGSDLASTELYQ